MLDYNVTYRKKDKGIQCIISYKDSSGKWKQKSKQGFKTQKDAKPYITKTVKELERQFLNENSIVSADYNSITFKQLTDEFIEHEKLYKEYNSIKDYKSSFANFSELNDIKVTEIKKADILKCIDLLVDKLRYITISGYLLTIKQVFNYYIENYDNSFRIDLNIKIPKEKNPVGKKALTKTELNNLINSDKIKKSKYYIVAYIAAMSGLRCGEILGLTWNDIDEKNLLINVNKQWKINKKTNKYGFGNLKSKNSYRKVPVSSEFIRELKEYKKKKTIDINNRIAPFKNLTITSLFNRTLKDEAGVTLHELRHTYITLLISNGIDFKTAAKIAGHDIKQTLNTYSHVTDDMMKNASTIISKIF